MATATYRSIVMYRGNWWGTRGDKVSTLCPYAIRRCQNRFVGSCLYRLIGARSPGEFARRCDQIDRPHLYAAPSNDGGAVVFRTNPKWLRLLEHGINVNAKSLSRLAAAFPELNAISNHPLWKVLSWDSNDSAAPATFLEHLRPHCTALMTSTYQCRTNARMRGTLGVPDWMQLAMPLALLRCSSRRGPQRRWLQEHFSHYLTLASLSPAYQRCFLDLWTLIDQWLQAEGLGTEQSMLKWPASAESFEYKQACLQSTREELMDCGWLPQANVPSRCALAMLWCMHLGGAKLEERLARSHSRGARRCPDLLRQLMRDLDPRLDMAGARRTG